MTAVSWPRGRYNRQRIDGFRVAFEVHLLWWEWLPVMSWRWGESYLHWLCFTLRLYLHYEDPPLAEEP